MKIAVLASGNGSNLQAIVNAIADRRLDADIVAVVSDVPLSNALERARAAGIPSYPIAPADFTDRSDWNHAIAKTLRDCGSELIVLAGFMQIVGPELLDQFPGQVLNIHPSLLPKYRGLNTYQRALSAGEKEHGASVHFVTAELDGGPVIAQVKLPIELNDNTASLRARVQSQEHLLYPQVIGWFAGSRLKMQHGRVWLDGSKLNDPVIMPAVSYSQSEARLA